jgi:peptidyl-prolyl isomerase D
MVKAIFPYLELTVMPFFLQKQDYKAALRKYRKALRYLDLCWEKEEIDEGKLYSL